MQVEGAGGRGRWEGQVEGAGGRGRWEGQAGGRAQHTRTIGNGRGCGLVNNPLNFKPRDATRILGRLALSVVEVGRHRHHGMLDLVR